MASIDESLQAYIPAEVKTLSIEKQVEYISELLSHRHRHHREEEEKLKAYEEVCRIISQKYIPLHQHLYQLSGWEVTETFSHAVSSKDQLKMRAILTEEKPGVYTFDMLSTKTCRELVEEIHHFEAWCKQHQLRVNRPNSMNNYGAILDDFGFQPVLDMLMKEYIQPFSNFLFPTLGQERIMALLLNMNWVTLNVCLGDIFSGGELFFRGVRCDKHVQSSPSEQECFEIEHRTGKGIFHVGRHRHGANDLTSGYRINLILWCRSSKQREATNTGHCACHSPCPQWCGLHDAHHPH